jgi:cytochrome c oxidase cbb3-type subunit 3
MTPTDFKQAHGDARELAAGEASGEPDGFVDTPHNARVFDGIVEENNPLPRWWVHLFNATIVFAGCYLAWYHLPWFPSLSQTRVFEQELAVLKGETVDPLTGHGGALAGGSGGASGSLSLVAAAREDSDAVARGKAVYDSTCASCHGADGGGVVGPNLTDRAWISGRTSADIVKVISEGVPAKGMPAWGSLLGARKVQDVAVFVASLQGTSPAQPKPPQGEEGDLE